MSYPPENVNPSGKHLNPLRKKSQSTPPPSRIKSQPLPKLSQPPPPKKKSQLQNMSTGNPPPLPFSLLFSFCLPLFQHFHSNNFIHGTKLLFQYLSVLFTSMVFHEFCLQSIPKGSEVNLSNSHKYRSIAISSLLGNILDHHIIIVK